jgi:cytochrome P450
MTIANELRAPMNHPDHLEKVRRRPDLLGNAVNECLRCDAPARGAALDCVWNCR